MLEPVEGEKISEKAKWLNMRVTIMERIDLLGPAHTAGDFVDFVRQLMASDFRSIFAGQFHYIYAGHTFA